MKLCRKCQEKDSIVIGTELCASCFSAIVRNGQ